MANTSLDSLRESIRKDYEARTPKSQALNREAEQYLPGGDTRNAVFFKPYPTYFTRGQGYTLTDLDGNSYIDLLNNYSVLLHGHAHPPTMEAIALQTSSGVVHGINPAQVELAKCLVNRLHGADMVRFCVSGTEATLLAIRAAKAITGRPKIMKMEGGYHGWHDIVEASIFPIPLAGPDEAPETVPQVRGLYEGIKNDVIVAPLNDLASTTALIEKHKDTLAAVILEPMLANSGMVSATKEYLQGLRAESRKHGVMLILDEIQTFRLGFGGMQEHFDVVPDFTCMAKMIGGGLPVGAISGGQSVMSIFDPRRSDTLPHSGTHNANTAAMVAGLATLKAYPREEVMRLNQLGDSLRKRLNQCFEKVGVPGQVCGFGSIMQAHFAPPEANLLNFRSVVRLSGPRSMPLLPLLHMGLMNQGVQTAPRGYMALSTPMSESTLTEVEAAFCKVLSQIKEVKL